MTQHITLSDKGAMKNDAAVLSLALVRQRYTPFGGSERFLARAMSALQLDFGLICSV